MIPYGRQSISDEDIAAVAEVLSSDWLTQGPSVPCFESTVTAHCGVEYGVAVNSATSALHLACLALGCGPGSTVWTTPNTFVATANCARYCGAQVDFVDIDAATGNIDPTLLADKLRHARARGTLPRIVIPVHFSGRPAPMAEIHALGSEFGFRIIEDASHALGATYNGDPVGHSRYSDITVFSFHPVKIITTGEGGMAVTRDQGLATHMRRLRSHGITRDTAEMAPVSEGPWDYRQIELGYNYRLSDLQAALGISQMKRLDSFVARRRQLAQRYEIRLAGLPIHCPPPSETSAWHLYVIGLHDASRRNSVFQGLRDAGIGVNVHYIPVHTQPYYQSQGFRHGDFPLAEDYYRRAITLPLHPGLSDEVQDEIISILIGLVE